MKKLTRTFLALSLFLTASEIHAGNPFTPTEKGIIMEYESKIDESIGIIRTRKTVTDIRDKDGVSVITIVSQFLDSQGEPFTEEDLSGREGITPQDSIQIACIKEKNMALHSISEIHVSDDKAAVSLDKFISEMNESLKHVSPRLRGMKVGGYAEDRTFPLNPYPGQELASATI